MPDIVSYNQLISLRGTSVKFKTLRGAYVSEGKLVIVFGNNKKFDIYGKDIEVIGQNKRVQEIISLACDKGFDIPEKSFEHYAKKRGRVRVGKIELRVMNHWVN